MSLTYEEAIKVFSYDEKTGQVFNISKGDKKREVGSINKDGYLQIRYQGYNYLVHRLAWLLATGSWPEQHIDHIDGNRQNNCLTNIRDVSRFVNQQNRHSSQGVSNLMGVSICAGGFQASINYDGKRRHLGVYKTPDRAHQAYLKAKKRFHLEDPTLTEE